ncbi:tyrosine-type recombinase/integrase [Candidatus Bathyarchaeota archaeon]|nr:tyrosine-type recombinase/integrase [Candidatus Bathyarchaeota archaeon]
MKEYLDSVANPNTRKSYRIGIQKFCEWFCKSPREVLEMRKDDLTQRQGEDLIEYRNRAARFEKEIEKFHSYLLEQGYKTNTARNLTLGIRQLSRFYQMPIRIRAGSKVSKTVKTSRSFPLRIEHVRKMFEVADLRERVILSMATDLGLRISDFIKVKKEELPPLDQESPIMFDVMTGKEEVVAHGFLSNETIELLGLYLPTLKKDNLYLFPSNGKRHISDEWLNRLLKKLVDKAQIKLNGKSLTFHCFRKMFMSTAIDSGIGLTAGKKLCGKAIPKSDDTYLTTMRLGEKFIQLKKFLTIKHTVQPKTHEVIEELRNAVTKLQEDVNAYKTTAETITEKNQDLEEQITEMRKIDHETMKVIEKLKQVYQQGIKELEMELEKERTRVSNLSKIIQPLIKKQMRKLGQKVAEEIKQTQTENKETD